MGLSTCSTFPWLLSKPERLASHFGEILPGLVIAQGRGLLVPLPGEAYVARNAVAFVVVDHAHAVHAGGVAERDALLEQAARFVVVATDALAAQIEQAEIVHC